MSETGYILLVDDEPAFRELAGGWLSQQGFKVKTVGSLSEALEAKKIHGQPDLVLLDLSLPPYFDPQKTLLSMPEFGASPVIIITGHADRELALQAISQGAWDFIAKPVDPEMLAVVVRRALAKTRLEKEVQRLQGHTVSTGAELYIGISPSAQRIRALIERIAPTDVRVLVTGPSGTGKEVISRALHDLSTRAKKPFISVHCGAIPAELLESELFGHVKGAFTGADKDKQGLLALADGGTLFLDEIGEMPVPMQIKLLRVLQEGTFYPVGGRTLQQIDVRIVSATNADLMQQVQLGEFREDLYYRIKGVSIETQALSERLKDIPSLLQSFLSRLEVKQGKRFQLSFDAMQWFRQQTWPGNVRELKNTLESVAAINMGGEITLADIQLLHHSSALNAEPISNVPQPTKASSHIVSLERTLDEQVQALEISLIQAALTKTEQNKTQAAKLLGLSRQGLIKKIERYQLEF
ncbi:sigma-54-dependent transcriptional regulator [Marinomonas fungiae]|uniref:DNA-binding transcriptional response regulator, NtrC family, contains REC, AAA-type ATPase, and a Fis-type DNA-binding domains n=1 Tax=Marinomonas fungiae TaxID=1137284 RepID=A0A0K6ISJ4_9GAMM|nr:sigma-54 dependent transcriptional regulator [Marinomonas fungiae]CUB06054.1 DNA-binding transcriptional response regulator, NtrC family, contains REC, AAA-type ATPase, and a Fis-type DNA-binding domains [Marinomonas fungiae]